jgi:hypothetical protein
MVVQASIAGVSSAGGRHTTDFRLRQVFLYAALYAVFLAASPFEHHDLSCELKTPLHCTACASTLVGSDPAGLASVAWTPLTVVGRAIVIHIEFHGVLLPVRSTGRSPPAAA